LVLTFTVTATTEFVVVVVVAVVAVDLLEVLHAPAINRTDVINIPASKYIFRLFIIIFFIFNSPFVVVSRYQFLLPFPNHPIRITDKY
jgi:hypothetical protein